MGASSATVRAIAQSMFNVPKVMRHLFIHSPPGALPTTADAMQALPAPAPRDSRAFRRTLGYVLGAVGVAGIGVAFGSWIAKEAKQSDRDSANACSNTSSCTALDKSKIDQLTNEARTRATVANVGFVAGGVALTTGVILVVTAWPASEARKSALVQPWIGANAAGLAVGGVW
jgi:hypothetical protein